MRALYIPELHLLLSLSITLFPSLIRLNIQENHLMLQVFEISPQHPTVQRSLGELKALLQNCQINRIQILRIPLRSKS